MPSREAIDRAFGRYRPLVSSYDAFIDGLLAPRAPVVWAHPERIDRDALAERLAADGVRSAPIAWEPSALRLPRIDKPGRLWTHAAGLFYVQEESSLLPVRLLDPRPGERVLDLCAAPGSKTARIALALGNRGTVVANDRSAGRLAATTDTIRRLGLRNVTCTVGDGARFPRTAGHFDKVLVDAPCSAEGAAHRSAVWRRDRDRSALVGVQRALLERAIDVCRPGGRVVYSTCTLAPEENEAVVDAVITEAGGARVVPVDPIEGLALAPAIDRWDGARFSPEVRHAVRVWPHHGAATGFFAAVIEKDADARAEERDESTPIDALAVDATASEVLARFTDQLGLPDDAFAGHRLLERGQLARLVPDDHRVPAHVTRVCTGLEVTRNRARSPKLSTAGAMSLGRAATRQVVQLSVSDAARYLSRESVDLSRAERVEAERDGYAVARVDAHALGLGRVVRREGALVSEFPKAWVR